MKITRNKIDILEYRKGQNNTTEIFDLVVNTQRSRGTGTEMINELKKKVGGNIYAFMRASNNQAHKFYVRNGFTPIRIPNFYPDESAYMMLWTGQE